MRRLTAQMMVALNLDDEDAPIDLIGATLEEELKMMLPSIAVLVDDEKWAVASVLRYHVQRITEQRDEAQRPA